MNNKLIYSLFSIALLTSLVVGGLSIAKRKTSEVAGESASLLIADVKIKGNKTVSDQSFYFPKQNFIDKAYMEIIYNLNGLCLLEGKASQIALKNQSNDQQYNISLSDYGQNCKNGTQTIAIALSDFKGFTDQMVDKIQFSFWYPTMYEVDILSILVTSKLNVLGVQSPKTGINDLSKFDTITPIYKNPYAVENVEPEVNE